MAQRDDRHHHANRRRKSETENASRAQKNDELLERVPLAGYEELYPPPSTQSLDQFLTDCQKVGVTHLVLTSAATLVLPDLGKLFAGSLVSSRVVDVPAIPGVRIFRLVG